MSDPIYNRFDTPKRVKDCPWCQKGYLMRVMKPIPGDECHSRAEIICSRVEKGNCVYRELPPPRGSE